MPAHDLPLPTFEEVLFCDSMTTSEEVGYYIKTFVHVNVYVHSMSENGGSFRIERYSKNGNETLCYSKMS